jgi:hypothetical protein
MTSILDLILPHDESSSVFSADRRYRYRLTRRWGPGPELMLVSLHPGISREHYDDPDAGRDKAVARAFGYDAYAKLNLFAARVHDAQALGGVDDPVGVDNDAHLAAAAAEHDVIVLDWGDHAAISRARAVTSRLWRVARDSGGAIAVLDWTPSGQPYHPLRVRADAQLQCLTAHAHPDMVDVDPRWTQLLADAAAAAQAGGVVGR